ncbi:hypothetical protein INT44_006617 [Umbelopsis vinacea]|uniref:Protein kinase domain-containing protein n=1 Tax=Umbelopsis vinacea TaxID=44442 RepID=A0A8H7U9V8_9FUNG|nr:hypothetical protein INT44_006617 [Umbelopsis vinacea]
MTFALASASPRSRHDPLPYTPTKQHTPTQQKRPADDDLTSPSNRLNKRPILDSAPHTPLREKHANQTYNNSRTSSKLFMIPNSSPSGNHSPDRAEDVKRVLPLQRAFESSTIPTRRKVKRHPDLRRVMLPDTPWKKPSTLESFAHLSNAYHTPIRHTSRLEANLIVTSDDEELENEESNILKLEQLGQEEEEEEDMVFTQPFALALRDSSDDRPMQSTRRSLLNELLSSSGISQPSSELEPVYENQEIGDYDEQVEDDDTDDEGNGDFGVEWPKDRHPLSELDVEEENPVSSLSNLRSSPPPLARRDSIWTSNGGLSSFTNDAEGGDDVDEVDVFFSSNLPQDDKPYDVNLISSSFATAWPHFLTREYFEDCQRNEANWILPDTPKDGRMNASPYFESNFHILSKIGTGEFAEVWNVRDMRTGEKYAIKKTKQPFLGNGDRRRHIEEVNHMWKLKDSQHCVELVNAWEQEGFLFIQMELCNGGSLEGYLGFEEPDDLSEDRIWRIGYDIAMGLRAIHQASLIHLDIKPANILIDDLGSLKIGDFGLSTGWPVQSKGYSEEGDRRYMAPELLQDYFDKPADIFSLGLILLEMAANIILPENGQGWQMLRAGDFSNCHELSNVSSELQLLISNMLHPIYDERFTVEQVLDHPKMKEIHMVQRNAEVGVLYQHIQRLETMAAVALGKRTHLQDESSFCTPVDERDNWDDEL